MAWVLAEDTDIDQPRTHPSEGLKIPPADIPGWLHESTLGVPRSQRLPVDAHFGLPGDHVVLALLLSISLLYSDSSPASSSTPTSYMDSDGGWNYA